MAVLAFFVALSRYRVCEREEGRLIGPAFLYSADNQILFLGEHLLEARTGNVSAIGGRAVNRIAEVYVVGRHRLGDRTRRGTRLKELARDFLAGADFNDCSVL